MTATLHEKHRDNLTMYVNDVIGLERDIVNAIEGQLDDDKVKSNPRLTPILKEIISGAKNRINLLQQVSEAEGGSLGATVKEAVMGVTGALAGLYGRLREHPVSRMVRDDRIAMNVVETSYAMLYTLALGIGHEKAAAIALSGLNAAPPLVLELTDLLPGIVLRELSEDAPLQDASAGKTVVDAIHKAWSADPG